MKRVTVSEAHHKAEREMARPVKACGFDERMIGDKCVSTFFYSVEYDELGTVHRADVYVEAKCVTGFSI